MALMVMVVMVMMCSCVLFTPGVSFMSSRVISLPWVYYTTCTSVSTASSLNPHVDTHAGRGLSVWRHHHFFINRLSVSLLVCKLVLSWSPFMWCFLKSLNTSAMLQTLDLVTQPYLSLWHHFPLIIYQSQSQNPKISKELTKAKCELWLTSQNLQFHFSTESPASLCVTSQSWKLTASWIWPDFDHLPRHIVIISKIKQKQNNAKHTKQKCQNLAKANT